MSNERIIARENSKMLYAGRYHDASKFNRAPDADFDLDAIDEVWVMDPEQDSAMLAIRSKRMGPHYVELTKDDIIWLLLEAQHKGWFEDV